MVCFLFHWQDECLVYPMPCLWISCCYVCMSCPDWLCLVHVYLSFLLLVVLVVYVPTCTLCPLCFLPVVCWTVSLSSHGHDTSYSDLDISWNINIIISSKLLHTILAIYFLHLQQPQSCDNKGLPEWLPAAKSYNYRDKHKHTCVWVCVCVPTCISDSFTHKDGPVKRNWAEFSRFIQHVQSCYPPLVTQMINRQVSTNSLMHIFNSASCAIHLAQLFWCVL